MAETYSDDENEIIGDFGDEEAVEQDLFSDEEPAEGQHDGNGEAAEAGDTNDEGAKKRRVEPVKKKVLNPRPKLNLDALKGPKGLSALNKQFENFKFKGNGHEKEDYNAIIRGLEQWSHRLFPQFHFKDSLQRMESLGKKKIVQWHLEKIRLGIEDGDEVVRQFDEGEEAARQIDEDDEVVRQFDEPNNADEAFDELLSQQISQVQSSSASGLSLTDDQKERIERNKRLAMERRQARKQNGTEAMEVEVPDTVRETQVS